MKRSAAVSLVYDIFSLLSLIQNISCVTDSLTAAQVIKDGETLISGGRSFELGFFSPTNSSNRYVGIWYNNISVPTVVWVANRETPLTDTTGFLEVIHPGLLVLRDGPNNGSIMWSSNFSMPVRNPVARLLDSGNLVVKDANDDNPENFLWQSFDYPTDTFLPGMKLGWNFVTGHEVYVSSWKSYDDPAPGEYTYRLDPTGYPQYFLKMGSKSVYRAEPWNGEVYSGRIPIFSYEAVFNDKEAYYRYNLLYSTISRFTLSPNGVGRVWTWDNESRRWIIYLSSRNDTCDSYGFCGANATCDVGNAHICRCLDKFEPNYPEKWAKGDWSGGCKRKVSLNCGNGDDFLLYSAMKMPDTRNSTFNISLSLEECKMECLRNCSCTAYSSLFTRNGGGGCLLWYRDLVDIKVTSGAVQDIYIRLASSDLASLNGSDGKKGKILLMSLPLSLLVILSVAFCTYRVKKRCGKMRPVMPGQIHCKVYMDEQHKKEIDLPLFEFYRIVQATDSFSSQKKIGEGGYGPVYWGMLEDGQEVAVKRLSERSTQGLDEFENEAICIAKLQHRNLVKLLGCCIEGTEKILIYEYMPNRSLDYFIFDQTRGKSLDWPQRFHIIQGIARGLLYLHQDSRLRVIHRDLKASNILLDADMNAKISDFGTARSLGGNETGDSTIRVVGTHGYMSPEYAVDGLFSVKSDVFSFGVMLLEIVSGKRNKMFFHGGHHFNLLGHVWKLSKEGRALELVDSSLGNSYRSAEVLRTIKVGLSCVQQWPEDRPDMSCVVFMLENEGLMPEATQPGFFMERNTVNAEISITMLEGR